MEFCLAFYAKILKYSFRSTVKVLDVFFVTFSVTCYRTFSSTSHWLVCRCVAWPTWYCGSSASWTLPRTLMATPIRAPISGLRRHDSTSASAKRRLVFFVSIFLSFKKLEGKKACLFLVNLDDGGTD